jgi:rhamnosyltransferase
MAHASSTAPTVLAVIPSFRPTENLPALVAAIAPAVSRVLVSDDASPCTFDGLLRDLADGHYMEVVRHGANAGVARGLNEGLQAARSSGATWLLTVDQDSMIDSGYVTALIAQAEDRVSSGERLGALGASVVADASGDMTYPLAESGDHAITHEVIQTGTLWSVTALSEIGGFDEHLGMDAVDAAACLGLRRRGYRVGVASDLRVGHAIGDSRMITVGGRRVMVTGHSPERRASMLRNRLRLFPAEFRESPRHALRTIRRVVVNQSAGLVLEEQRWEKVKGSIRGLRPKRTR